MHEEIACKYCGLVNDFRLGEGKGPHAGSIICNGCERFIKWISKSALIFIQSIKNINTMATVDFNNAIYYTISDGKICRQHREPVEGSITRVNKNGKTVHETFHKALKGRITDIKTKDGDFGKQWIVTLQDESGQSEQLQFQYSSGYANGFLRALPNVDFSKEVIIAPNLQMVNDKKKTTVFLSQLNDDNGKWEALKWYFTKDEPNGLPDLEQKKFKGKITWDDTEMMEFLEKMVNTEILPKLKGFKTVAAEVEEKDEAPF